MFYSLHLASSYVLEEYFLASHYKTCLGGTERMPTETGRWAKEMREDSYHRLYTHAFIGMWAAFEAGVEDAAASFIEHSREAAQRTASRFKAGRYVMDDWPWSHTICVEIAKNLDPKAKDATVNGGVDIYARLQTMFGWLDVSLDDNPQLSADLAEASRVRNAILHRYGQIDAADGVAVPTLALWVGKVMPMDEEKFNQYYRSIANCLVALFQAISRSPHKPEQ